MEVRIGDDIGYEKGISGGRNSTGASANKSRRWSSSLDALEAVKSKPSGCTNDTK